MISAKINHITRLRINSDGNGVRSVIFMQNCPLDCVWCCNPETQKINKYKTLMPYELFDYIKKDIPYFHYSNGGITFSGGEPLLNIDFLKNFIETYCNGFSVNIETSLYTKTEELNKIYSLIDEWYVDFKVYDENKHIKYTGVSNHLIKKNIKHLASIVNGDKIIITYPMIPGYNTSKENVEKMIFF